jgi:hypothetical protein
MELGHALVIFQSLILISTANGAPVLFARLLGTRFARPIDGGGCAARRPSSARSFQDLAWPRRCYRSRDLRRSHYRSPMAGGCDHRCFSNGRRLPLVLRQAENGPRDQQHVDRSRSGSRIALSRGRLQRLPTARSYRRNRYRLGVLGRRAGDVASLLRRRLTGSTLLRRTAQKLVQGDLRPIVKAHRDDRGPRPD